MTKEKTISLENYRAKIRAAIHGKVPIKHEAHPLEYKAFLERELKQVDLKLEGSRLAAKEEKAGK
jgi:hypothetical protein